MTKRFLVTLVQILLISLVLFLTYYFFYLKPKIESAKNRAETRKILSLQEDNLIQNRLAFVELTKLDPKSSILNLNSSDIMQTLERTHKTGLDLIKNESSIPKNTTITNDNYNALTSKSESIFNDQKKILYDVINTKSYKDGVAILKSKESIDLLTRQTNLILEYQYWIKNLQAITK